MYMKNESAETNNFLKTDNILRILIIEHTNAKAQLQIHYFNV